MEHHFPLTYQDYLFICRVHVREAAIRASKLWLRNKCHCETTHDICVDRDIWIQLVKHWEDFIMRNEPELRDVQIADNYDLD